MATSDHEEWIRTCGVIYPQTHTLFLQALIEAQNQIASKKTEKSNGDDAKREGSDAKIHCKD